MSSRARLVDQEARPYDWRGSGAAPLLNPAVVETIEAPRQAPDPVSEPVDEPRLAAIERHAHAEGYDQGERAGTEAAGIAARGLLRRLAATIDELSSTRQDVFRRTERQVVELAMAIAKHMLQRELNVDRGLLLAMARVALDGLGDHEAATIRLHPDDYAIVRASADREWASDQVTVVADPAVEQGGCLVQCGGGLMKVGLESQFNELARSLLGEQGGDRADRAEARHGATASS
jgi:flagellar assembly protein FliH